MLRMSTAKVIGIASVLSMIWAGNGAADDAAPRGRATSPVKMSCRDYANSYTGESSLTTPILHISGYSIPAPTSKSSTEFCATIDISKLNVTKDVSSFYWVWAVTDNEKACEAAAATRNSTMKGWEQEHINDAINIVATETSKLRDSVKDKIPVCASKGAEAVANLKKVVDTALKQGLADRRAPGRRPLLRETAAVGIRINRIACVRIDRLRPRRPASRFHGCCSHLRTKCQVGRGLGLCVRHAQSKQAPSRLQRPSTAIASQEQPRTPVLSLGAECRWPRRQL
jgi:hypothetical protein